MESSDCAPDVAGLATAVSVEVVDMRSAVLGGS
jgi:hypothetical protein